MNNLKVTEKTKISKTNTGWQAEIFVNIKGFNYLVRTAKVYNTEIVCSAIKVEKLVLEADITSYTFNPLQDKKMILAHRKTAATEKAVKEVHFEGLMTLDRMDLPSKADEYKIEPGQVIFLNGYGQNPVDHENLIIYKVEDGTAWYVNETRLTLGVQDLLQLRPVEKLFGIGHYYKKGDKRQDMNEVNNLVISAALADQRRKDEAPAAAARAAVEEAALIDQLVKENPHLEQLDEYAKNSLVAKNMRKHLKKHFPGVVFSVVSDISSINISWNDGPSYNDVKKQADLFESHQTDETGDFRDYTPTLFTKTFGGVKYVFCNQHKTIDEPFKVLEIDAKFVTDLFSPVEEAEPAILSEIDKAENDKSEIVLSENVKAENVKTKNVKTKSYIVDHSERGIALMNAPEAFKKLYEAHYGVYKAWVKHNGNVGAWVFSKKRRAEIQSLINSLV